VLVGIMLVGIVPVGIAPVGIGTCTPDQTTFVFYSLMKSFADDTELSAFYRAMHISAKRGIAIACRLSVCPSVCLSVTLVNCDHIG